MEATESEFSVSFSSRVSVFEGSVSVSFLRVKKRRGLAAWARTRFINGLGQAGLGTRLGQFCVRVDFSMTSG